MMSKERFEKVSAEIELRKELVNAGAKLKRLNAEAKLNKLNDIYKVLLDARSSIVEVTTRVDLKDALDTETHLNTRKVTDELNNECFGIYREMVDLKCKIELLEEIEKEASK